MIEYLNIESMMMVFRESCKAHMRKVLKRAEKFDPRLTPVRIGHTKQWSLEQVKMLEVHFRYYPIRSKINRKPRACWYEREEYDPLKEKKS